MDFDFLKAALWNYSEDLSTVRRKTTYLANSTSVSVRKNCELSPFPGMWVGSEVNRTGALLSGLTSFGGCRDKTVLAAMRCTMRQSQQRMFEWSVQGSLYECSHPPHSTSVTTASSSFLIRLGADTPLPVSLSSWIVIKWQLERNRGKEQELGGRVGWGARPWTTEICRSRRFLVGRVVLASTEW